MVVKDDGQVMIGGAITVRVAQFVAEPQALITTPQYNPALFVCAFGIVKQLFVAPAMGVVLPL